MGQYAFSRGYLPLLLLFLLALPCMQSAAQDTGNLYNTAMDVRQGEEYFQRQCSRCHGQDARGDDETGAPDLTGRLSRASSDAGVFRIIRDGIPGTAMLPVPADTLDQTVWQLVAYINSLRTTPADIDLAGSPDAGRSLFAGKGDCLSCHMVAGTGGRLGPDLSRVGERLDPRELKTALIDPDGDVAPRWWTLRATLADGSTLEGLRMDEDSFAMRIMDADAELWSVAKKDIESYERFETSTMPDYSDRLTEAEIDHLVAYLFSLRRED